jgi:Domain of unknown function (DUF4349)
MKQFFFKIFLFVTILLVSISCGSKTESNGDENNLLSQYIDYEEMAEEPGLDDQSSATMQEKEAGSTKDNMNEESSYAEETSYTGETISLEGEPQAEVPKKDASKIIKTAGISYQFADYENDIVALKKIIKKHGGFISNESETNSDTEIRNEIVIRVDNVKFDVLVSEIMTLSAATDYKNISAQDITEEYVDLQTRLKTKKKVEARYEAILLKANTIYDILQVEEELAYIREEIESVEGKLRYYDDRVSYSTISLSVYETLDYTPKSPSESFGSKLKKAVVTGWRGIIGFFIGLVYIWPFWLILFIGFVLLRRFIRRRKKKRQKLQ